MKSLLMLCLFACALQVNASGERGFVGDRSFVGEGTWSDSAERRGVMTSRLYLGWLGGVKVDYDVEFDNGEGLRLQMIVQPHRDGSCSVLTLEKEVLGTCYMNSETGGLVISFAQDGAQIELRVFFLDREDDTVAVVAKKFANGNIVSWNDELSEVSE